MRESVFPVIYTGTPDAYIVFIPLTSENPDADCMLTDPPVALRFSPVPDITMSHPVADMVPIVSPVIDIVPSATLICSTVTSFIPPVILATSAVTMFTPLYR